MNCNWDIVERDPLKLTKRVRCSRKWCRFRFRVLPPVPAEYDIVSNCTGIPFWHEFGHWLEIMLQVFGITKRRWAWITRQEKGCGCNKRQEAANRLGERLANCIGWFTGKKQSENKPESDTITS